MVLAGRLCDGESVDDAKAEGDKRGYRTRRHAPLQGHVGNAVFATLGGDGCLYCDGGRSTSSPVRLFT